MFIVQYKIFCVCFLGGVVYISQFNDAQFLRFFKRIVLLHVVQAKVGLLTSLLYTKRS